MKQIVNKGLVLHIMLEHCHFKSRKKKRTKLRNSVQLYNIYNLFMQCLNVLIFSKLFHFIYKN